MWAVGHRRRCGARAAADSIGLQVVVHERLAHTLDVLAVAAHPEAGQCGRQYRRGSDVTDATAAIAVALTVAHCLHRARFSP